MDPSVAQLRRQVEKWRDDLIDLSRRNRLLRYRPHKASTLTIVEPGGEEILRRLIAPGSRGWRFYLPAEVDDGDGSDQQRDQVPPADDELLTDAATAAQVRNALKTLRRRATDEFLDKGINILFLGFGLVEWSDVDGDKMTSPVLLVPVELVQASAADPVRLVLCEEDAVVNPALAVKFATDFDLELPEPELDDEAAALSEYLSAIRHLIAKRPDWAVKDDATVLSLFSFHKLAMYKDLQENLERACGHPLVGALGGGGGHAGESLDFEPVADDRLDAEAAPETLANILDADATQRQCIVAARDGRSFVMDGPPGTGKSQTIANVIAELLANDKTVLFVSEKAAALDVVESRLADRGLGHFILQLHSHKATRKEVAGTLGQALGERPKASGVLTDLDLARLRSDRAALSAYASAHNRMRPLGRSVHWAIGRCAELAALPPLAGATGITADLGSDRHAHIMEAAEQLARHWAPVRRGEQFLWRDLADPQELRSSVDAVSYQLQQCLDTLEGVAAQARACADPTAQPVPTTVAEAERLLDLADHLTRVPAGVLPHWLALDDLRPLERRAEAATMDQANHLAKLAVLARQAGSAEQGRKMTVGQAREALRHIRTLTTHRDVRVGGSATVESISTAAQAAEQATTFVSELLSAFGRTAGAFGWRHPDATAEVMGRCQDLVRVLDSSPQPDPDWFGASSLAEVGAAASALREAVAAARDSRTGLGEIFEPTVFAVDVEAVFEGDRPKLSRLSGRGRANRKMIVAHLRPGVPADAALARLRDLRSSQRAAARLRQCEARHGGLAGRHYQGLDTDFDAVNTALQAAQFVIDILGPSADWAALGSLFSAGSSDHEALRSSARRVETLLERWANTAAAARGALPGLAEPVDVAARQLRELREHLQGVADLARALHLSPTLDLDTLSKWATLRLAIDDAEAAMEAAASHDSEWFGADSAGLSADWAAIRARLDWVVQLRGLTGGPITNTVESDAFLFPALDPAPLRDALARYDERLRTVVSWFAPNRAAVLAEELALSFDDAAVLLADLRSSVVDVETWAMFCWRYHELSAAGLQATIDDAIGKALPAEQLSAVVERAVLQAWLAAVDRDDEHVRLNEAAEDRDDIVQRYRELDAALRDHAIAKVVGLCAARRPTTDAGEPGLIRKQAQLKRKHMPVRRLLAEAGQVAQALKPCFMMSPLSVSTFLPSNLRFDVVIFDEASQIRPCDALNAIYRGQQLIIAGDRHQLPPTSYFDRVSVDDTDTFEEGQLDDFESILDLAKSAPGIRSLPLRWHYRSRHESLITYSNVEIYTPHGHRLVTYPGAVDRSEHLGVVLRHVPDGRYGRGTTHDNPVEAAAVVQRVLEYATASPDTTVGVVAFSDAQAQRIYDELDLARAAHPELDGWFAQDRLDGFFVKNLENVQGDERDVIVFSIGYGYDEAGKLSLNFGPINKPGGYRRLNVAVTRARCRVEVFTSITHADIDRQAGAGGNTNDGVRHLRNYLAFAAEGVAGLHRPDVDHQAVTESPFEDSVLATLRAWGWDVIPQVGQSGYRIDLAVRHPHRPGEFVLGVECDGWAYHSSPVARDRDRLRQEILEGLGWTLHRIWGTAWYRRRAHEEERLKAALEAAMGRPVPGIKAPEHVPAKPSAPVIEVEPVKLDDIPAWAVPYPIAYVGAPRGMSMDDPSAATTLRKLIGDIVRIEGPISETTLRHRLREAFGAGRVGANMQAAINHAVKSLIRAETLVQPEDGFLDLPGRNLEVVRYPDEFEAASQRPIEQIPTAEIELAIVQLVGDARSIELEELKTRIRSLFGFERTGRLIDARIQACSDRLAAEGRIVVDGGTLELAA